MAPLTKLVDQPVSDLVYWVGRKNRREGNLVPKQRIHHQLHARRHTVASLGRFDVLVRRQTADAESGRDLIVAATSRRQKNAVPLASRQRARLPPRLVFATRPVGLF